MSTDAYHTHRCACGLSWFCQGVRFTYSVDACVWPCPRRDCPDCAQANNKRWTDWLKTLPEARRGRVLP